MFVCVCVCVCARARACVRAKEHTSTHMLIHDSHMLCGSLGM